LTDAELRVVWNACGDDEFGRVAKLLMLTACRKSEIGDLQWSEIDLGTGLLVIGGARTKNGSELRLTLPAAALTLLPPRREGCDYVFGERGFKGWSYVSRKASLLRPCAVLCGKRSRVVSTRVVRVR
jgi:integrase